MFIVFLIAMIITVIFSNLCISVIEYNLISWLWHGVVYSIISIIIYFSVVVIFFKKETKRIKEIILKKFKKGIGN